jgi:hypothetical protein
VYATMDGLPYRLMSLASGAFQPDFARSSKKFKRGLPTAISETPGAPGPNAFTRAHKIGVMHHVGREPQDAALNPIQHREIMRNPTRTGILSSGQWRYHFFPTLSRDATRE